MTQIVAPSRAITTLDEELTAQGVATLRAADPALARVIDAVGPCRLAPDRDLYYALVHAIISQQISTKAKNAIITRLRALYDPDPFPKPERLLATPDDDLRAIGCSRAKVVYLKDLSARIVAGTLDLTRLPGLPDEDVIAELVAVKGIGRWTAEMLLIFALGRPDVWPVDDLGIVVGVQRIYDLPERPNRKAMLQYGERWRPFRTIASWYLWRSAVLTEPK